MTNSSVFASFTISNIVAASGQFTMGLTGAQTTAFTMNGTEVYDVQIVNSAGITTTYLYGTVTMGLDVTHS